MKGVFGLGGYVGGTVKAGTTPVGTPFHLMPKNKPQTVKGVFFCETHQRYEVMA